MWTLALLACTAREGRVHPSAERPPVDSAADSEGSDDTGSAGETGDTGTVVPLLVESVDAAFEQVGTGGVVRVTWSTPDPSAGAVLFGEDELDHTYAAVDSEDGLTHAALVIGLAGGVPWRMQAVARSGTTEWRSDVMEITPPRPPDELVDLTVDAAADGLDGLVLTSSTDVAGSVMLLDRQGRYVWWRETTVGRQVLQTALSRDGTAVEWLEEDDEGTGSTFYRVPLDGSAELSFLVPYGHHSFTELPEGGWAFIERDIRAWDGSDYLGDRIVEYDAGGNETRVVWSAWDDYEPTPADADDPLHEWTHFNGIQYLPDRDAYLVTALLMHSVILVDRATGEVIWRFGRDSDDFSCCGEMDETFERIHQAQLLDGGHLLLFDNGTVETGSSLVEYALDEDAGTAERAWTYAPDPSIWGKVRGNAVRLLDGGTFASWGSAGVLSEISADGDLRWQLTMGDGYSPGFSSVLPDLGGDALQP